MQQLALFHEFKTQEKSGPVNVSSIPQRSPFRYPGGKTWLVPFCRQWLKSFPNSPRILVEPFAGGGIIGLTAAFENLSNKVLMVEMDDQIAAVWKTILGEDADWLAKKIISFPLNMGTARAEFSRSPKSLREFAFKTLLKNRTSHGGILAEGAGMLKHGENGKGIHSRWYPQTIARRITDIKWVANRIEFIHGDAFKVLDQYKSDRHAVFFIDPPYTVGGKRAGSRLYKHFAVDHDRLFSMCEKLRGDFLMTYDNSLEVQTLAQKYCFQVKPVAMKNTHHAEMTELLIGRDLTWLD